MSDVKVDVPPSVRAERMEFQMNPLVAPIDADGWGRSDDSITNASQNVWDKCHISTAEEYLEVCGQLDRLRCHVGERLSSSSKKVYGSTWPCSRRIRILFRFPRKVKEVRRNTEVWEREDVAIMLGPRWMILILDVIALALFPALTNFIYMGISHWMFHLTGWILCAVNIFLVLWCAMTDPGIVPRRQQKGFVGRQTVSVLVPVPNFKELQTKLYFDETVLKSKKEGSNTILPIFFDDEHLKFIDASNIDTLNALRVRAAADGMIEMELRFCSVCRIYRAPRTHHCRTCNCCVDEFDHHCAWTGCCIGKNNYHKFFFSLAFLHIEMGYIFAFNVYMNLTYAIEHPYISAAEALGSVYFVPLLIYFLIFIFGVFMTGLLTVHVFLQVKGITTFELLRKQFKKPPFLGVNPWSLGSAWRNMKYRLQARAMTPLHSEIYYAVLVASLVTDRKADLLLTLSVEQRQRVLALQAGEQGEEMRTGGVAAEISKSSPQ